MLFEVPTKQKWDDGAKAHDAKGHTNYFAFLQWTGTQKRCWPSLRDAAADFEKTVGLSVKWDL